MLQIEPVGHSATLVQAKKYKVTSQNKAWIVDWMEPFSFHVRRWALKVVPQGIALKTALSGEVGIRPEVHSFLIQDCHVSRR